jgi:hypothetical protein
VVDVDFGTMGKAEHYIAGTTEDLIRDGYDNSQPWVHNLHARPEDYAAAFLISRGWSATMEKREAIAELGLPVMAVNDYPADGPKPWYWCSGDGPSCFSNRIWDDPDVTKFCEVRNQKFLRPRESAYEPAQYTPDAPNVHFFHQVNNLMETEAWLHVPYIAWGTSLYGPDVPPPLIEEGSARSSMLIGLRLLWHLGFRRIYLLGCDCTPHHHPAPNYWKVMFKYIEQIAEYFPGNGLHVFQTNPDSHLRTFAFADFWQTLDTLKEELLCVT